MTALEWLKARYKREFLLLILNDLQAQRVMIAWTIEHPEFKDFELPKKYEPASIKSKIWEYVDYRHIEALAESTRLPFTHVLKIFNSLRAAELIYPDGTIPAEAHNVMIAEIQKGRTK